MKKVLTSVILVICLIVGLVSLVACNDPEAPETPFVAPSFDFERPEGLADYSLKIEWFNSKGEATTFNPNRPTAVIFTASTYNVKEGINLDYENDYTASVREGTLQTTSFLWNRQGFNVGVFHYEAFADDTDDNVVNKIFYSGAMTYKDTEGAIGTSAVDFNLTEAFISAWLKVTEDATALSNGGGRYMQEVRFIGNGTGAVLALSVAEYLDYLYENGAISDGFLADRVDLIDPYFSNRGIATLVDFYPQTTVGSALLYSSNAVTELATKGTVFTVVESDAKYYESYKENDGSVYDGIEEIDGNVSLSENGRDTSLYLKIKQNSAYLNFSESYSTKLNDSYSARERSTLDWFLYTVNGSEFTSVSNLYETDIRPVVDGLNMAQTSVSTSTRWGVSAWTPTAYLRAMRGYEYRMAKYSSSKGETAFTMDRLQAESYQISNVKRYTEESPTMLYAICGYVYEQKDNSEYVNLNRSSALEGVTVDVSVSLNGKTTHFSQKTGTDGFYMIDLGAKYAGASVTVTVATPSKDYSYAESSATTSNNFRFVSRNLINKAEGITVTLDSTKELNYLVYFANVAFTK